MRICTLLSSRAAQMLAACWKAIRRCSPRVVPVLPPTGETGVGSLKPTPGALTLTITICAGPAKLVCAERPTIANAKTISVTLETAVFICRALLLFRGNLFNQSKKLGALFKSEDAPGFDVSVVTGTGQHHTAVSSGEVYDFGANFTLR